MAAAFLLRVQTSQALAPLGRVDEALFAGFMNLFKSLQHRSATPTCLLALLYKKTSALHVLFVPFVWVPKWI